MKQLRFLFTLCVVSSFIFGCGKSIPKSEADQQFEQLANNFIQQYLSTQPEEATLLGDHRYDDRLNDYSPAAIQSAVVLRRTYLDSLKAVKVEMLSPENRIDYDILHHNLLAEIFAIDTLREWENNPMTYNCGDAFYSLIARDNLPLAQRMKGVMGRLSTVPQYIKQAKVNLKTPSAIHTQTAIRQNVGTISLLNETLTPFIDSLPKEFREEIIPLRDAAVESLEDFGMWMKLELLPRSAGDFRLGKDLYNRKLAYSLDTDLTAEAILQNAESDLVATTQALFETAFPLYQNFFPGKSASETKTGEQRSEIVKAVLDRLSQDRPSNSTIVEQAKKDLQETTEFVRAHNIVTVPSEPVEIIVMPEFQRGVAVAYCDSPGPFEQNAKTFYAISPTPAEWSESRKESFYKEYNNYMLKNLTVHEAMPGHYLQLAAGNAFKARTMIRGIFQSGIFAEGWATYTEQVMVDAGYGGAEVKMQQLKMRLRLIINAIIDQKIHTAGMTEREALDLMMKKGFQEEGEATGKWKRACLTSAQLSTYYVGNTMFNDVRKRYEENAGAGFDMKTYHDKVISFGTISPRYLPTLLQLPVKSEKPSVASL